MLSSVDFQQARILLIDDNDGNRRLLAALLRSDGYAVDEASTGRAALLQAAGHRPSLVITEFRLPDMTATELMHRLRVGGCASPVFLVTGDVSPEARSAGAQAATYPLKPYDIDAVLEMVASLVKASPQC